MHTLCSECSDINIINALVWCKNVYKRDKKSQIILFFFTEIEFKYYVDRNWFEYVNLKC